MKRAPGRRFFRFLAISLSLGACIVAVQSAQANPAECAQAFHSSLSTVKDGPYQTLREVRSGKLPSQPVAHISHPGKLSIAAPKGSASKELQQARQLARKIAAQGGNTALPANASSRWVAERLQMELGDYLGQEYTPFMCSGVPAYLTLLRNHAAQVAISTAQIDLAIATLQTALKAQTTAALDAMRPPPLPRHAPADRPDGRFAAHEMVTALDVADEPEATLLTRVANSSRGAGIVNDAKANEDLAPRRKPYRIVMHDRHDLDHLARRLVNTARRANMTSVQADPAGTFGLQGAVDYIATVAPLLQNGAGQVRDARARPALLAALADLEMLDTLMVARDVKPDPLGTAFAETFDAIEQAYAKACDCATRQAEASERSR
ncbi:hypothetical protein FPY71_01420 [Aureimonas fodinaquatilis]|uniref:Uncharacterized protein n=1 Tax=Aureimonas fodinaquatilis TaxID=2565783 RepID=A0A5B0E255_9HYPH|nr:hypothetical protein [Aureimonas fodinaquatilis]KAA0971820.1 hypothetical protein FPY71_01420 [Aureimonas fodinaquatilis]